MNAQRLLAAVLATALAIIPAYAAAATQSLSKQDKTWLTKAHQTNLAEIKAGRMAERKAKAKDVRSVGMTLVSDHRLLDKKLKPVAMKLNVKLPSEPTAHQQAVAKQLAGKSGAAFDEAWTKDMIKGHKKAIEMTTKEIRDGHSKEVQTLAKNCLPVLQKHLSMLKNAAHTPHGSP